MSKPIEAPEGARRVLDSGYVALVEAWGSDESVVCAARMSTGKGFCGFGPTCSECGYGGDMADHEAGCSRAGEPYDRPGDEKLLKYLWDRQHQTPFEMCGVTIEVKAPIFVFREWHRHRIPFGYNELSSRYTPLPDEDYVPSLSDLLERANAKTSNRQAQGAVGRRLAEAEASRWIDDLRSAYDAAQRAYEHGLGIGVPKELARLAVPVARYSRMRATGNLRGWLAFLKLRCAPDAQKEIRMYANVVAGFVKDRFPRTYAVAQESLGLPA